MSGPMRDWALAIAVALLAAQQIRNPLAPGIQTTDLRCVTLTVVDEQGRPRIVLDGAPDAGGELLRILDSAGTVRLAVSVEQAPQDEISESTVRLRLLDHEAVPALELIEDGNRTHGRSSRLDIYSLDLDGKPEAIAMFGTRLMQGWPSLEMAPQGGGLIALGLGDGGLPVLNMRQSPLRAGREPGQTEERKPDEIGFFSLRPGSRIGQVLVGESQELVSRPVTK